MTRIISFLGILFLTSFLQGQNLVQNHSFEDFKKCPKSFTLNSLKLKKGVKSIKRTPDYFNFCSDRMNPLSNLFGKQAPYHGDGYCGLILTSDRSNECSRREYLELKLSKPLVAGEKYVFSLQTSLAENSGYSTDQIGAIFNTKSIHKAKNLSSLLKNAAVNNPLQQFITDTTTWTEVKGIYNAKGGEEYVVIGNFQACNQASRKTITPNDSLGVMKNVKRKFIEDINPDASLRLYNYAYYFIDHVSLTPYELSDTIDFLTRAEACSSTPPLSMNNTSNLVHDGSFSLTKDEINPYWKNASRGTPDFLENKVGLYFYSDLGKNNREYIISSLKEELTPCNNYYLSFKVKRNNTYRFAVDHIEVAFTDSIYSQNNRLLFPLNPDFQSPTLKIIESTNEWITLCGEFSPTSCANYMILGNFTSDDETYILPVGTAQQGGPFAYYFIDDVALFNTHTIPDCQFSCSSTIEDTIPPIGLANTQSFVSDTVQLYFNTSQSIPSYIKKEQLKELSNQLLQDTSLILIIEGHTDNTGPKDLNNNLSKKRAESLLKLMEALGVPSQQIQLNAYGSSYPAASNESLEGRRLNRRVKLYLINL